MAGKNVSAAAAVRAVKRIWRYPRDGVDSNSGVRSNACPERIVFLLLISRAMDHPIVHVEYPPWIDEVVDWNRACKRDEDRMHVAIGVARANVERATGGPFGAAIFES